MEEIGWISFYRNFLRLLYVLVFILIISINTLKNTFLEVVICYSTDSVNVKPGKSTTYATCMLYERKKHLLCFSGNPAKVLISAHLFLLPLLNQMCHNDLEAPIISACVRLPLVWLFEKRKRTHGIHCYNVAIIAGN